MPTVSPAPGTVGWRFIGVRATIDESGIFVVGEMVNRTGAPQEGVNVSGVFYDRDDQVIRDGIDTLNYVPVEVVPEGAHIPFELVVDSADPVYRIELVAISEPAADTARQDFQFVDVSQWQGADDMYCIGGQVQNPGSPLDEYLVVLATTYDGKGHVVSFGEHSTATPAEIVAGQSSPFSICIDPLNEQIARYQLWALGR